MALRGPPGLSKFSLQRYYEQMRAIKSLLLKKTNKETISEHKIRAEHPMGTRNKQNFIKL